MAKSPSTTTVTLPLTVLEDLWHTWERDAARLENAALTGDLADTTPSVECLKRQARTHEQHALALRIAVGTHGVTS